MKEAEKHRPYKNLYAHYFRFRNGTVVSLISTWRTRRRYQRGSLRHSSRTISIPEAALLFRVFAASRALDFSFPFFVPIFCS